MRIVSGDTSRKVYFVAVDATDFSTRETGLSTFTVYRSRDGGTAAAMGTPTVAELDATNMPGVYALTLDEDMTISSSVDSEEMCFHITHAGMAPVTRTIELYRPKITSGNTLGVAADGDISGDLDGSVGGLSATSQSQVNAQCDSAIADAALATSAEVSALNDVSSSDILAVLTTQLTESYAANGAAPTLTQAILMIQQALTDTVISGTTKTVREVDGVTTAATFTLDDASSPTSITRAT